MKQKTISAGNVRFSNELPFSLIAGPCQMESREHALEMADALTSIAREAGVDFVYKSSFDKANRTSISGKRGIGFDKAMPVFEEIKAKYGCPVLTDIHNEQQCADVASIVDILQVPAFLCRQTDLLIAAAKSGCVVNIKKGQFLAPWDMKNVAAKVSESGNDNILLTDRGTSFGYNTLISDMRGLKIMADDTGYPVIIDATHSIQQPGGQGGSSGGQREFVPVISRAAVAVGVAGIFMETHQDPDNAPSDGPCMVVLKQLPAILEKLVEIDKVIKK